MRLLTLLALTLCALAVPSLSAAGDRFPAFRRHVIDRVGQQLAQTALADIDRDGDLDWVAGQAAGSGGDIWWWEYRSATEWVRHELGKGNTDVGGAAHDVDGDGWLDVLSGSRLLLNSRSPREKPFTAYDVGAIYSHDTEFADIDGDGRMDALANCDRSGLFWYEIPRDPTKPWKRHTVATREEHEVHAGVSPRAVGDLDGDGDNDIVTAGSWYENVDGKGRRWKRRANIDLGEKHRYGIGVRTWVVDLDGDGDQDIVQSEADNPDARVAWFENDGKGEWTRHMIQDAGGKQDYHSLAVADFDLDGDLDVYSGGGPLSANGEYRCSIWENTAGKGKRPTSKHWVEHVIARSHCHEAVAADVDGDGDIDICSKPWRGPKQGGEHFFLENTLRSPRQAPTAAQAPAVKKPNVLFIAIDDQNDWIGCLDGHPQIKTPNIDRLADRGTVFTNAHCQSPLCNPSRTSLMTGLRPTTTGIYGLAPWFRSLPRFKDRVTLPQHFAASGYRNYSTGKIYHGGYGRRKGDSEFQVIGPPAGVGAKPPEKLVKTPAPHPLVDWGVFPHRDEDKGDWRVAEWAIEQLDAKPEEPFFLSVGFFLPHVPCYVTKKWIDLYPEETLELPPVQMDDRDDTPRFSWYLHWKLPEPRLKFLQDAKQWKNLTRSYLASTSFVDSLVGRVLGALDRNGFTKNTIVVLWSDHGWHIGEKLITGKNTLWDRSTRVPLIFAGPGVTSGGRCSKPAELLDIYPTLIELCGLPERDGLEGHSLVPQLRDASAPRPWPAITSHNRGNHGIRSEDWRYIRYADGSEELYDMRADPNEWTNLAGRAAEDPKLRAVLEEHRKWLPEIDEKPAPGSRHRILTHENDKTVWEGKEIRPGDPVPELD